MADSLGAIESSLQEQRVFPPPPEFARHGAHQVARGIRPAVSRVDRPARAVLGPDGRGTALVQEVGQGARLEAARTPSGSSAGRLNARYNCLDAQIEQGRGDKTAILWEGEPESGRPGSGGSVHRITYRQLRDDVCRFANGLKKLGVKKGDRVTIYMPMVPEAAIAMLACARIGAPHSVIFGGFSSQAIADRVEDAKSDIIITADGGYRRGQRRPAQAERRRGAEEDRPREEGRRASARRTPAIERRAR